MAWPPRARAREHKQGRLRGRESLAGESANGEWAGSGEPRATQRKSTSTRSGRSGLASVGPFEETSDLIHPISISLSSERPDLFSVYYLLFRLPQIAENPK